MRWDGGEKGELGVSGNKCIDVGQPDMVKDYNGKKQSLKMTYSGDAISFFYFDRGEYCKYLGTDVICIGRYSRTLRGTDDLHTHTALRG